MTSPVAPDVEYEASGAGAVWVVLGLLAFLAIGMGVLFFAQYSRTMSFVKHTLEEPAEPLPWEARDMTPGECAEEAMSWAGECRGIKAMCDMYVDRAIVLCMESQDRATYCESVADETSTRFGSAECRMRGVQRNVDAEACAKAYEALLSYCDSLRELGTQAP